MLETFRELAVKEPDLMRLVLQASVTALVNVQGVEVVDAERKRRAVNGDLKDAKENFHIQWKSSFTASEDCGGRARDRQPRCWMR